jgi:hypothetical protein
MDIPINITQPQTYTVHADEPVIRHPIRYTSEPVVHTVDHQPVV